MNIKLNIVYDKFNKLTIVNEKKLYKYLVAKKTYNPNSMVEMAQLFYELFNRLLLLT